MRRPASLNNPATVLAADASMVINLSATGCAATILKALPNAVVVPDAVSRELEPGRRTGRGSIDILNELVVAGLMRIVSLDDAAALHFEGLVVGEAAATLDDGEAATIAYAVEHGAIAIIDERKANRICSERFPGLSVASTVDIFAHADVVRALGQERLAAALVSSLKHAHMRVLPHHVGWVVGVIGATEAAHCLSLPRAARQAPAEVPKARDR